MATPHAEPASLAPVADDPEASAEESPVAMAAPEPPSEPVPVSEDLDDRVTVPEVPAAPKHEPTDVRALGGDFLSSEFFVEESHGDSVRPTFTDLEPLTREEAPVLTPELARRRRAFRRAVGAVVGAVGIASIFAIGLASLREAPAAELGAASLAAASPPGPVAATLDPAPAEPRPAPEAAAAASEPAGEAPADEPSAPAEAEAAVPPAGEPASVAASDSAASDSATSDSTASDSKAGDEIGVTSSASGAELRDEALALLNRGKRKEAVVTADRAIAADATDAMPYLVKGSALMDLGDWPGAKAAFDACATHATTGARHECFAMGGQATGGQATGGQAKR